jgi:hypothetical protein
MSYFVLIYDRSRRELLDVQQFEDTDRASADTFRLQAQRKALDERLDQEIVLFQAQSREALERTHGSYFLSIHELLERGREAAEAS